MLDITTLKKETFAIKTNIGILHLFQPKVKTMNKLLSIINKIQKNKTEVTASDVSDVFEVFRVIINKNKEKRKISMQQIEDNFDMNDIILILNEFFNWVGDVKQTKNS